MTDNAAIRADFVKPNSVPSRKVLQLIFEVPEEQADHAMQALGGHPQSGQNRWCAIALLKSEGAGDKTEQPAEQTRKREHRDWDDVPPTEQAGIRCNEPRFQKWLHEYLGGDDPDFPTDQAVRNYCGVSSRRELNTNAAKAQYWRHLDMEYQEFIGNQRYQTQLESGRT